MLSISNNSLYLKGKCTNSSSCTNTIWEPTKWNIPSVQPDNKCYNYGNDKITNTFAQPGRAHGITLAFPSDMNVTAVRNAALADGLISVGSSFRQRLQLRNGTSYLHDSRTAAGLPLDAARSDHWSLVAQAWVDRGNEPTTARTPFRTRSPPIVASIPTTAGSTVACGSLAVD